MVSLLIEIYDKCGEKNLSKLISEFNNEIDVFIQQHQLNLIIDGFLNNSTFIDFDLLVEEPSGLLQIALLTNDQYKMYRERMKINRLYSSRYNF